jgi:hypothetical protein
VTKFLTSTALVAVLASAAQAAELTPCPTGCDFHYKILQVQVVADPTIDPYWLAIYLPVLHTDGPFMSAFGDPTPYQSTPPVYAATPRTPEAGGEAAPLGGAPRPVYSAEASVPNMPATCPQPTEAEDKAECEAMPEIKGLTISLPFFRFSIRLPGGGPRHYAARPHRSHSTSTQVARRSAPTPSQPTRVAAPSAPATSNTMDGK